MKIAALIAALALSLPAMGRTAAEFFAAALAEAVPMLTTNARLDMLDYFHSGVETATSNMLNGKARVVAENPPSSRL